MDGRTSDSSATADGLHGASANRPISPAPGSAECFAGAEQFSSTITGQVMGASNETSLYVLTFRTLRCHTIASTQNNCDGLRHPP